MERTTGLIDATEDFPEAAKALHIAYFIPVNWGIQDRISRSLVDFQHGRDPQAMQWVRLTALLAGQILSCDVIVRALSSTERKAAGGTPLDKVCMELARRMNVPFAPERLQKSRLTQAVKNAGARSTRVKLLLDAYRFDGVGLPERPRVLVVDDVITTGATLSAIASAIRKTSPAAEIQYLALARTEPHLALSHLDRALPPNPEVAFDLQRVNAHLDERYFSGTASPVAFRPRPIPFGAQAPLLSPRPTPTSPLNVPSGPVLARGPAVSTPSSTKTVITFEEIPDEDRDSPGRPGQATKAAEVRSVDQRVQLPLRRMAGRGKKFAYAAGSASIVVLLAGVYLLVKPAEETQVPEQKTVREGPVTRKALSDTVAKSEAEPPAAPKAPPRPRVVIALPSVGLRANPGFDAPPLSITLTQGDRVTILDTYVAVSGPNWVKVRTRDGKIGWVFAGGVRIDSVRSTTGGRAP